MRAKELLGIIGRLGPAIIKAGQALSSRPDLLPKEYLDELQKLQVSHGAAVTAHTACKYLAPHDGMEVVRCCCGTASAEPMCCFRRPSKPSPLRLFVIARAHFAYVFLKCCARTSRILFRRKQDRVPAFSNSQAFAVVESELGVPFGDVYELVEPEPIAAASIGQASSALVTDSISGIQCLMLFPLRHCESLFYLSR